MNFSGLCAFPLTPLSGEQIDWSSFVRILQRLVTAKVDSIGVLGSTGCYPYFSPAERREILQTAVEHAGDIPVMVSISSLRLRDVLASAEEAQKAGAAAVLLSPVSYHPLREHEVFSLYQTVTRELSVPLCVYDNPGTTQFCFSPQLLGRIAELPNVQAIKIPPIPTESEKARQQIAELRTHLPAQVRVGISGDSSAAEALIAGCDLWFSVTGGLFPETAANIVEAVKAGQPERARQLNTALNPLWSLYARHGSLRVIAAAAELAGYAQPGCLPLPLQSLAGEDRETLHRELERMGLIA
ncbi:dihydrodipicolinate synthase family protein [Enterobacteriaceae bacterium 89]|nr:dihydrodipicolinate synthase family protein [Enterobacteriaceae bacterium 89]